MAAWIRPPHSAARDRHGVTRGVPSARAACPARPFAPRPRPAGGRRPLWPAPRGEGGAQAGARHAVWAGRAPRPTHQPRAARPAPAPTVPGDPPPPAPLTYAGRQRPVPHPAVTAQAGQRAGAVHGVAGAAAEQHLGAREVALVPDAVAVAGRAGVLAPHQVEAYEQGGDRVSGRAGGRRTWQSHHGRHEAAGGSEPGSRRGSQRGLDRAHAHRSAFLGLVTLFVPLPIYTHSSWELSPETSRGSCAGPGPWPARRTLQEASEPSATSPSCHVPCPARDRPGGRDTHSEASSRATCLRADFR